MSRQVSHQAINFFLDQEERTNFDILFVCMEVFQAVFSLFIIFWQFYLSLSLDNDKKKMLESSEYNFIMDQLVNFDMIFDLEIKYTNETCSDNFYPYVIKTIAGFNNTCIEENRGVSILRFEPGCNQAVTFNSSISFQNLWDYKLCCQTFPKNNFIYSFVGSNSRCAEGYLTCGATAQTTVCLLITPKVTKCPIIYWSILPSSNELPNGFYLIRNMSETGKVYAFSNYSTANYPLLSTKVQLETYTDNNYYDFYSSNRHKYGNNSDYIYGNYTLEFDPPNNYLDINPYYKGKFSNFVNSKMTASLTNFFMWNNISNDPTIYPFYQTINPEMKVSIVASYLSLPTDGCIKSYFLNDPYNNDRGLFNYLSDISFEFLNLNILFYMTWNLIQIGTYCIYFLLYRVRILRDKINLKIRNADMESEKVTIFTLKMFFYLCLMMKLIILYKMNINTLLKHDLMNNLVTDRCFANYYSSANLVDDSLIHINLRKFLNGVVFNRFIYKSNIIYTLTFVEIGNEVINLCLILFLYFKICTRNQKPDSKRE